MDRWVVPCENWKSLYVAHYYYYYHMVSIYIYEIKFDIHVHTIPYMWIWWRGDEFDGKLFQALLCFKLKKSHLHVDGRGRNRSVKNEKIENELEMKLIYVCIYIPNFGNGIVYNWKVFFNAHFHCHIIHCFIFTLCTTNYMPFYRFPSFLCACCLSLTFNRHSRSTFSCALSLFYCSMHYDITHYILHTNPLKCHQIRHKLCSS